MPDLKSIDCYNCDDKIEMGTNFYCARNRLNKLRVLPEKGKCKLKLIKAQTKLK